MNRITLPMTCVGVLLICCCLPCERAYAQSIIYVDDDAPPGGDGTSWNTAFRFLQDALAMDLPAGTEIRVAQGVYKPDRNESNPAGTGDSQATFLVRNQWNLTGGFAGINAADPDERNVSVFETILSGDLLSNDLPDFINYEDNATNVVTANDAVIDGFVIAAGRFRAILISDESPSDVHNCTIIDTNGYACVFTAKTGGDIVNCTFDRNKGALWIFRSSAKVQDCSFIENSAAYGGAIHVDDGGVNVSFSEFHDNSASVRGGVHWSYSSFASFFSCTFTNNQAPRGGALYFEKQSWGGAQNCMFQGNSASQRGGAVYNQGDSSSYIEPRFYNCVFFENTASSWGSAMYNVRARPRIINCSIVRNTSSNGGAIYNTSQAKTRVRNSIIKGNIGGNLKGPGQFRVDYSNVGGNFPGTGNINKNPKFVNHSIGDLRLKPSSPCIDAGRSQAAIANLMTGITVQTAVDADGNPRFVDVPGVPNTGSGSPPIDMGAYEFQP